jgi:hypothetical protein
VYPVRWHLAEEAIFDMWLHLYQVDRSGLPALKAN